MGLLQGLIDALQGLHDWLQGLSAGGQFAAFLVVVAFARMVGVSWFSIVVLAVASIFLDDAPWYVWTALMLCLLVEVWLKDAVNQCAVCGATASKKGWRVDRGRTLCFRCKFAVDAAEQTGDLDAFIAHLSDDGQPVAASSAGTAEGGQTSVAMRPTGQELETDNHAVNRQGV